MKKKIESVVLVFLVICCVLLSLNSFGFFTTDFSKVELVYENDGAERYYYDHLTDNAKIAYTLILPEIYNHTERIEIPEINDEEFDSLMYALSYDNPDIICYGRKCEIKFDKNKYYFYPTYTHSKDECAQYTQRFNAAVEKALSDAPKSSSDYEKELFVHDYICRNCIYLLSDEDNLKSSAYDVLVDGTAVCEGYARAAQLLLGKLGIVNYLVTGDGKDESDNTVGHMWNIVTIDNMNYNLDITWDDMDDSDAEFSETHMYFNVTDELTAKTHFNISPSENNCVSEAMNYFSVNKTLFNDYSAITVNGIKDKIYNNYLLGISSCEIRFTNASSYSKAKNQLIDKQKIFDIITDIDNEHGDTGYTKLQYIVDDESYVIKFSFS